LGRAPCLGAAMALLIHISAWGQVVASPAVLHHFDIQPAPLAEALSVFSEQSQTQILFESRLADGLRVQGFNDALTAADALERLLEETGVVFRQVDARTFVIRGADAAKPTTTQASPPPRTVASRVHASLRLLNLQRLKQANADIADIIDPRERIVVTGTRLARTNLQSLAPTTVVGQAEISASGSVELGEILANLPMTTFSFSTANTQISTQNAGLSAISLRNLGTSRTLVLIDGRRSTSNSGNGSRFATDTIPPEFVERVEVITGGASAIYGSDAVAGVVNFILRDTFEGLSVNARAGTSQNGGGDARTISVTAGASTRDNRANMIVNFTHDQDDGIIADQRSWAITPFSFDPVDNQRESGLSSIRPGGRFSGSRFWYDENGLRTDFSTAQDGYNRRPFRSITIARNRTLVAVKSNAALSQGLTAFFSAQYAHVATTAQREAQTAGSTTRFGPNRDLIGAIPFGNPFIPDAIRSEAMSRGANGITWRRRFSEVGLDTRESDRQTTRAWIGIRGERDRWEWEATYGHSAFLQTQLRSNELVFPNIRYALDVELDPTAIGQYRCVDANARNDGCVPLDLFGEGAVSPAAATYIRSRDDLHTDISQDTFGATVNGSLFALPAGEVWAAAGIEHRIDRQNTRGDPVTQSRVTGYAAIPNIVGEIDVTDAYAEIVIPVLANRSLAHALGVEAAVNIARYSLANVDTVTSYRFGVDWAVSPELRIRSQWARAQRAPSLSNVFSPPRDDFDTVLDPCDGVTSVSTGNVANNCRATPGIASEITANGVFTQATVEVSGPNSGNPDLREEVADTATLGLVATPRWAPGVAFTIDYYDISIHDAISFISNQTILGLCYAAPANPQSNPFCAPISRASNGQISEIISQPHNLNEVVTSGIDVTLAYDFALPDASRLGGDIDLRIGYAYLETLEQRVVAPQGGLERVVTRGEVGHPVHAWTAALGWRRNGWRARWRTRYVGQVVDSIDRQQFFAANGVTDPLFLNVDAWLRHDLYVHYAFSDAPRVRAYAGVNNVFHDTGPFLPDGTDSGGINNFNSAYDPVGRYIYGGVRVAW